MCLVLLCALFFEDLGENTFPLAMKRREDF